MHRRVADGGFGAFIRGFNYDGLGRLTRAQSPYPDPDTFDPEHPGGFNGIERFYYDGVRRIQEVVIDPVSSMGEALVGASISTAPAPQVAELECIDGTVLNADHLHPNTRTRIDHKVLISGRLMWVSHSEREPSIWPALKPG